MPIRRLVLILLPLLLVACGQPGLHVNLRLDSPGGLRPGDPVVLEEKTAGEVEAVEPHRGGGYVAKLAIASEFAPEATRDTRFVVARDPKATERRRVRMIPGALGAAPLPDGAEVRGSFESEPLLPFGEMLRGLTEGLNLLFDQVEQFRSQLQRLPDSEEGRKLKDEWTRLLEEMKKAEESAGESMKKEWLPKWQREMEELERRFRELDTRPRQDKMI
jgi:hypothetical protein